MNPIRIEPFAPAMTAAWNEINRGACNGHFFFDRRFLAYHADRFEDRSVMFFEADAPVAILAAHRTDDRLISHQGLTFGGLVYGAETRLERVLAMLETLLAYARLNRLAALFTKMVPATYHDGPADDQLYALSRAGARLVRREITTTIDYGCPRRRSHRRDRGVRCAVAAGLVYGWDQDYEAFWKILAEVLGRRHGATPTHTVAEIRHLSSLFPEQIRLFAARDGATMLAGVVVFETRHVAHAQYIAASPEGQAIGALDGLFDQLIRFYEGRMRYFDFGISTEDAGRTLNQGLVGYKQDWGGRGVVHDCYEILL